MRLGMHSCSFEVRVIATFDTGFDALAEIERLSLA